MGFDISTLDKEAQSHIKDLEGRIHDLETQTSDESSPHISDEVLSALPDEVRVELAAARARADEAVAKAEAAEAMAAVEKESRVKRELQDRVRQLYSSLPGTVEEKGAMLGAIETLNASEQNSIKVRLAAGNKAIETLMASEVGETTHSAGSTYEKIESLANELMQTEDITKAQAIRKISKSHESLYAEYVAENRQSIKQ